jgi:hypothetical protein
MITNTDKIIDSRDIIERLNELEQDIIDACGKDAGDFGDVETWLEYAESENVEAVEEYRSLYKLQEQCEDYSDWQYGETLIHADYWLDYVEGLLIDCGDLPRDIPHYIAIDWEKTADYIESDYTRVDFNGEEYLIRNV